MYKATFSLDHSASTFQKFIATGTDRIRLKKAISLRVVDGFDQRDIFVAKSPKPFLVIITTTAKKVKDIDARLSGKTTILIVNKNNIDRGVTRSITLDEGLRSLSMGP